MKTSIPVSIRPFPVPETVRVDLLPIPLASAPAAPAAAQPQRMHILGGNYSYQEMRGAGWSDKELKDSGYGALIPHISPPPVVDRTCTLDLGALDPEQLETLCGDFREAVFERAGKRPRPRVVAATSVRDGHDFEPLREAILHILGEVDSGAAISKEYPEDATALSVLRGYVK